MTTLTLEWRTAFLVSILTAFQRAVWKWWMCIPQGRINFIRMWLRTSLLSDDPLTFLINTTEYDVLGESGNLRGIYYLLYFSVGNNTGKGLECIMPVQACHLESSRYEYASCTLLDADKEIYGLWMIQTILIFVEVVIYMSRLYCKK